MKMVTTQRDRLGGDDNAGEYDDRQAARVRRRYSFAFGPRQWSSIRKASSTPAENAHTNTGTNTTIGREYLAGRRRKPPDTLAPALQTFHVSPVGFADTQPDGYDHQGASQKPCCEPLRQGFIVHV